MAANAIEVPCDLCGSMERRIVFNAVPQGDEGMAMTERYAASSGARMQERVVRCEMCGLVFISPRLPEEAIHEGYQEADNTLYLSQREGRLRTFRRAAQKLARRIPPRGRLLDVGCAAGYFVQAAREMGWQAEGVEISKHLADSGRREFGLTIHQGDLHHAPLAEKSFDVVTFWDVLEHAYAPSQDLERAYALLKPSGYVFINYPAFDSLWAKIFGRRWWFLISVHLTYFTRRTIRRMAEKVGFEPVGYWMHIQWLELSYLLYRLESYAPKLARPAARLATFFGMSKWQIPYYASQIGFLARRPA